MKKRAGSSRVRRALRAANPAPKISATNDRAAESLLTADDSDLVRTLRAELGHDQVLASATDLVRYSSDASPYRMIPKAVVVPRNLTDLQDVLRCARRGGHSLTLRAAGTSLNGQAQTDDILVDMRAHFGGVTVMDDGARLQAAPGVIVARANAALHKYGRMLGPDPASMAAATIGGVVANNASGMTSGIQFTANKTLDSIVVMLASGTIIDTGAADADERLAADEPDLFHTLSQLRDQVMADTELCAQIRRKYLIKNTTGMRLDALLEAERVVDIVQGLMVGSEGILGIICDTTWHTRPIGTLRATGFLHFADLRAAAATVVDLNRAGAQAVELMDCASLRSLIGHPAAPAWIADLDPTATDAVVLTERRADTEAELVRFADDVERLCVDQVIRHDQADLLTRDPQMAANYWALRKGLLATIGAARPAGTALITEDVVVDPRRLPEAVVALQNLLVTHGFTGAVNGHASAGNLHFYLYLDATSPAGVAAYRSFMDDLVELIVGTFAGSLKGEHGTGRNVAPFVRREWGDRATDLMYAIKRAFDPHDLLGRGIMLNDDLEAAFTHLKSMPTVDAAADPCIECGFCEPVCPSRRLTTTPRQRIVLRRELARQGHSGDLAARLVDEYEYQAIETCAGDSSCALACPVGIDTGTAMKNLRHTGHSAFAHQIGRATARHFGLAEQAARLALATADRLTPVLGDRGLRALTQAARAVIPTDIMPTWLPELPAPAPRLPATDRQAQAVLFPACINRIFGPSDRATETLTVTEALVRLAERAGRPLWIPDQVQGSCCGTIWHSKGFDEGFTIKARELHDLVWSWTAAGQLPVVVDAASCTWGIVHDLPEHLDQTRRAQHRDLRVQDALTYTVGLLATLPSPKKVAWAVTHPTCSMHNLGIAGDLSRLAAAVADEVFTPIAATCCGFAGDRGLLHPELTSSATAEEAAEVSSQLAQQPGETVFLSGNRTCELGMEHATGHVYESPILVLERLTRPIPDPQGVAPERQ